MFESILNFFKRFGKSDNKETVGSKSKAKERLHLVLMQDRANVSADFLELMKQEIIDVIKKYIEVEENEIDVRLTNEVKEDGTTGAPSLYANIPILNIRNDMKKDIEEESKKTKEEHKNNLDTEKKEDKKDDDENKKEDAVKEKQEEGIEQEEKEQDNTKTIEESSSTTDEENKE